MEFKFNGSSYKTRIAFLDAVRTFSFTIRTLVADKRIITSDLLKDDKQSFYSYFIKMVLQNSGGSILDAKIRIDGSGDRIFRRRFMTYLRRELNSKQKKIIKHARLVDSQSNVLIQMADMLAGTIRRFKEKDKPDGVEYWNKIKKKIEDCWEFN